MTERPINLSRGAEEALKGFQAAGFVIQTGAGATGAEMAAAAATFALLLASCATDTEPKDNVIDLETRNQANLNPAVIALIRAALTAEQEICAQIADKQSCGRPDCRECVGGNIATKIRERSRVA